MAAPSPRMPAEFVVRYTDTAAGRVRSRIVGGSVVATPPVVSLMGLAVSDYQLPALAELATWTEAHLLELPGQGRSGSAKQRLDVAGYARAVRMWLAAAELPPVVLIGNSSSTQIAASLAALYPDRVCALVLASPAVDPMARSVCRAFFYWWRDSRYPMPGLRELNRPEWFSTGPRELIRLLLVHVREHLEESMEYVRCPVLVLRGEHDRLSTDAWARDLAARAPAGRFVKVPGPHTFVWTHPAAWSGPIREIAAEGCALRGRGDQQ